MKILQTLDTWQQKHRLPGFAHAVIKRYGEDHIGYQAALLTYYGFLALFPILLVATTVASMLANERPHLQENILMSTSDYFPVLGDQLSDHVHTLHQTGVALVVGILFTLYGARGVADVFQHAVKKIWQTPPENDVSFPRRILKDVVLILIGGFGFFAASVLASLTAAAGQGLIFRSLSVFVNVFILFWLFTFLLNVSLPRHVSLKQTRAGALAAAVGLVTLQIVGSLVLTRQLKSLDALYSTFAIALGLLFWIYLQAQVLCYSVEIAAVKAHNSWPRSLTGKKPTLADERADERKTHVGNLPIV